MSGLLRQHEVTKNQSQITQFVRTFFEKEEHRTRMTCLHIIHGNGQRYERWQSETDRKRAGNMLATYSITQGRI